MTETKQIDVKIADNTENGAVFTEGMEKKPVLVEREVYPVQLVPCPSVISQALNKVQQGVNKIDKDAVNNFGKYNYASVDAYYNLINPLLSDAGLIVIVNEVSTKVAGEKEKTLRCVYEFILMAAETGEVWQYPMRRTILIKWAGTQSLGAGMSYAHKYFYRTLFNISTGEEEKIEDESEKSEVKTKQMKGRKRKTEDADSMPEHPNAIDPSESFKFDYSGSPYRIFGANDSCSTYTDLKKWGTDFKNKVIDIDEEKVLKSVWKLNEREIKRIDGEIPAYTEHTDKQRQEYKDLLDWIVAKLTGDSPEKHVSDNPVSDSGKNESEASAESDSQKNESQESLQGLVNQNE